MSEPLSVSAARKLTGKSESTIKRMIREITADKNHEDRGLIEPSHEELERRKAAKEPYVWKIDESLLKKRYPLHDPDHAANHGGRHEAGESATNDIGHRQLIELLQRQLAGKDSQIKTLEVQLDRKDEQILNLNERTKEVHILMQTLQKRLELDVPVRKEAEAEAVTPSVPARESQYGNETVNKKRMTFMDRLNNPIRIFKRK